MVLLGGNGGHGLEVAVEVALVKKAALKGGLRNPPALPEQIPGPLYPAIHAVGVGRDAGDGLESTYQRVGINACLPGQKIERQIFLQICRQHFFQFFDILSIDDIDNFTLFHGSDAQSMMHVRFERDITAP